MTIRLYSLYKVYKDFAIYSGDTSVIDLPWRALGPPPWPSHDIARTAEHGALLGPVCF